jgi:hypothetical protein
LIKQDRICFIITKASATIDIISRSYTRGIRVPKGCPFKLVCLSSVQSGSLGAKNDTTEKLKIHYDEAEKKELLSGACMELERSFWHSFLFIFPFHSRNRTSPHPTRLTRLNFEAHCTSASSILYHQTRMLIVQGHSSKDVEVLCVMPTPSQCRHSVGLCRMELEISLANSRLSHVCSMLKFMGLAGYLGHSVGVGRKTMPKG